MTDVTMDANARVEALQDMLEGAVAQRNSAQNECMQLAAQVRADKRRITELEAKLKELEAAPLGNGHDLTPHTSHPQSAASA